MVGLFLQTMHTVGWFLQPTGEQNCRYLQLSGDNSKVSFWSIAFLYYLSCLVFCRYKWLNCSEANRTQKCSHQTDVHAVIVIL